MFARQGAKTNTLLKMPIKIPQKTRWCNQIALKLASVPRFNQSTAWNIQKKVYKKKENLTFEEKHIFVRYLNVVDSITINLSSRWHKNRSPWNLCAATPD